MKKIIAFTGSNSSSSINKKVLDYASSLIKNTSIEVVKIDLTSLDIPIFGVDLEEEIGLPKDIHFLIEKLQSADAYIISSPEHNGLMPAFFKNILDWLSRSGVKHFGTAPILLLGTSPGRGGARKAIEALSKVLPYGGGKIIGIFSLPLFNENFNQNKIVNEGFDLELKVLVDKLEKEIERIS